jgi:putative transcriptional regulator
MPENLRGMFLVAAKHLLDPNFARTVVLVVEHGDQGAMGLVVNRPAAAEASKALAEHFHLEPGRAVVFNGGPVEPQALFLLHDRPELAGQESPVISGLFLGNNDSTFEEIMREATESPSIEFRIFTGCAGWAPRQLEGELENGDWHLVKADYSSIFRDDPYNLYVRLLQQVLVTARILPSTSQNPLLN